MKLRADGGRALDVVVAVFASSTDGILEFQNFSGRLYRLVDKA